MTKGSISGVLLDPQAAAVPGADIKAVNADTGETATTTSDNSGIFRLNLLTIGKYKVEISKQGFKKTVFGSVNVASAQDTGLGTIRLEVGDIATSVEVTETAPLVDSTEAQISTTFTAAQLNTMPSIQANQGLDFLALYVPGVSSPGMEGFSNTNGTGFAVEGIRARNNDQQIDGQYNNDNSVGGPSLFLSDSQFVQEYQLTTNNMSAEYGRNSGSVVNILTKSGGNTVHGSIYGTEGNSGLDALNNTQKEFEGLTQVPHYNDSFAGATIGGPMIKDKLFYFGGFDTEIIPQSSVDGSGELTPTPGGIAALESCYPYPGGIISPALQVLTKYGPYGITAGNPTTISPVTKYYDSPPDPNSIDPANNDPACAVDEGGVQRTLSTGSHQYNWVYKMDLNTDKNRFYGRYLYNYSNFFNVDEGQAAAGYPVNVPALSQDYAFSWVRTITERQVNEFRASYGRENVEFGGNSIGNTVPSDTDISSALAVISTGSGNLSFGPADNLPQGRIVNSYQLQDNWTYIKGRHALKAGVNFTYQRSPNYFLPYVNGGYHYEDYVSMAENTASSINVTSGDPVLDFREKDSFLYAQDDFKLKNNLTLNLGLTWSYYGQPADLFHNKTVAQQSGSEPFWNPSLPTSVTTFPSIPAPKASFGPNVGFAWTPAMDNKIFGNNKTTIRGGYRLAYDPPFYNIYLNIASAAPNVLAQTITPATVNGTFPSIPTDPTGPNVRGSLSSYLTYGALDPRTFNETSITPNFGPQKTSRWSLGVQRELSPTLAIEARYVGNHATNLYQSINENPYIAGIAADFPSVLPTGVTPCTAPAVSTALGRVNCNEGVIRQRTNSAYSDYDGLELEVRTTNLWRQLTMRANYTWSKTTDNADEIFGSFSSGQAIAFSQDPLDYTGAEHGLSALDFPQQFHLLMTEAIPFYREQHGALGHILGGWAVSAAYIVSSGQPYTAQQEFVNYYSAPANLFPNGSPYLDSTFSAAFNGTYDGGLRPFLGNPSAPATQVGIYAADACNYAGVGCSFPATQLLSFNDINNGDTVGTPVLKSAVRFIANGYEADQIFGTPFGNVGRNTLRAAPTNNVNLSLIKNIKFWERVNLQLHLDAQDVFNHLQPNGGIDPFIDDAGEAQLETGFANTAVQPSPARVVRAGLVINF
ncbi:MAG: TonB-dependent receptor [Candidatus Acidiferrum sp.]